MSKKNFTRKDLSKILHQKIGFSKNFSSTLIDDFFEFLMSELINENKVKITSFGTFKINKKKSRIGRNPKTKIDAMISPRKVVKFKPSLLFKEKLNKSYEK